MGGWKGACWATGKTVEYDFVFVIKVPCLSIKIVYQTLFVLTNSRDIPKKFFLLPFLAQLRATRIKLSQRFLSFFFQGEASPFFYYLSLILLFSFFETCQPEYTRVTKKCFYPTLEGFNFNFEKSEMCLWPRNPFKSFVLMCVTGYPPSHKCRS